MTHPVNPKKPPLTQALEQEKKEELGSETLTPGEHSTTEGQNALNRKCDHCPNPATWLRAVHTSGYNAGSIWNIALCDACNAKRSASKAEADQTQKGCEERVIAKIIQRQKRGIAKYGLTMERTDLRKVDWLRHAQEEALDLAVYLERLITDCAQ